MPFLKVENETERSFRAAGDLAADHSVPVSSLKPLQCKGLEVEILTC